MPRILNSMLVKLSRPIVRQMYSPLQRLRANRQVERIDVLVIGDMISDSLLSKYCSLEHAMKVLMPGRSLATSATLLAHLSSVLSTNGTVVIVDGGSSEDISVFDYPYLSQVTKLEMGVYDQPWKTTNPFRYIPEKSLKILFRTYCFTNFHEKRCPDDCITELCKRKGLKLIYLHQ